MEQTKVWKFAGIRVGRIVMEGKPPSYALSFHVPWLVRVARFYWHGTLPDKQQMFKIDRDIYYIRFGRLYGLIWTYFFPGTGHYN